MSLKQEEKILELDTIKNADLLPRLSEKENIEILQSIKDGCKDEAAFREKIFIGNIYLVINLAKKYSKNDQQFDELFQEGSIALFKAIKYYKYPNVVPFISYVTYRVNNALLVNIPNLDSTIRFPIKFNSDLKRIKRLQTKLGDNLNNLNVENLVKELNMSENSIEKHLNKVTSTSLDAISDELVDDYLDEYIDRIDTISHVKWVLTNKLTKLEELIIRMSYGIQDQENPSMLYSKASNITRISAILQISRDELIEIKMNALRKIKDAIRSPENLRLAKSMTNVYLEFWALIDGDVPTVLEKIGLLSNEEQEVLYSCFGYNLKKKCYDQDEFTKIKDIIWHLQELLNPKYTDNLKAKYLKDYLNATDEEIAYLYKSADKNALYHQLFEILYGEGYMEAEMGVDKLDYFDKQRRMSTLSNFRKKLDIYRAQEEMETDIDLKMAQELIVNNPNSKEFIEAIPLKYQFITELRLGLYDGNIYSLHQLSKIFGLNNNEVLKYTQRGIKYLCKILSIYQNYCLFEAKSNMTRKRLS